MKDAYYFSHDANARNDEKILMLRAEFGWEGYGIFWALLEMMFESTETCLHHSKIKGLAVNCNIDITLLQQIISYSISEGLFISDDEVFYSKSLIDRKEKFNSLRKKRSEAGKKGMESRYNSSVDNTVITPLKQCNNTDITNSNKGKEKKERKVNKNNNDERFAEFWELYPKKQARQTAEKSFNKINPDEELFAIICNAVVQQSKTSAWIKENGQYVPMASTWLNGKRWKDEIKKDTKPKETLDIADRRLPPPKIMEG